MSDHIRKTRETLNKVLAANCEKTLKKVTKDTERDYWMNAKEALAYGIVDSILGMEE